MNDMTPEQIKALSDAELRIKVAKLLGTWSRIAMSENVWPEGVENGWQYPGVPMGHHNGHGHPDHMVNLPNWPHDLNACHEMEKALECRVDLQMLRVMPREYPQTLHEIVKRDHGAKAGAGIPAPGIYRATARQRCEAFVWVMEREQ